MTGCPDQTAGPGTARSETAGLETAGPGDSSSRTQQLVQQLAQRIRVIERVHQAPVTVRDEESACRVMDGFQQLLKRPLPTGCLIEWLADGSGGGVATLALLATRALWNHKPLVLIDEHHEFYAPAVARITGSLETVIFIRPEQQHLPEQHHPSGKNIRSAAGTSHLWALEQTLRTRGIGAVWCAVDQLSSKVSRRLQLAAETGGGTGLLLRPLRAGQQPSFAELRFLVTPEKTTSGVLGRRWRVQLLHSRGELRTGEVLVELNESPDSGERHGRISDVRAAS